MSAITGILYRDGRSVNPEQIKKMNDKLVHRGLNGSKTWCEGSVAFGHQMLFTTQESLHEELPFVSEEMGLVITADARIDNREELSEYLGLENNNNVSDSVFILKSYDKWGESCLDKLLGDFAFAIWDLNKEELFCARDHMGVKPFYYYLDENIFVFSTEIKALFMVPEIPYKLNQLMAAYHFIPFAQEEVLTYYKKILRLPSAHLMKINQSHIVNKQYWELNPNLKIQLDSDEDYIKKFNDIFNEAVRCRLRSVFPIGAELSGGLDSSSVVGVAKKIRKNYNFPTFSLISNFPEGDEKYYIQKMINSSGIEPHFLFVDEISPLNDMKKIIWHSDRPVISANSTLFWSLYKIMQNNNIRIILNGFDGDSVLSHGQNYLKELTSDLKIKRLIQELNGISEIRNVNPVNIFFHKVVVPNIPLTLRNIIRKNKFYEGEFILNNKELDDKLNIKENYKKFYNPNKNYSTAKELHHYLIVQNSHQNVLELKDSLSSAFFIENRYPFFDKRLIEFCYGIPTELKFKFGWDRLILRQAMEGVLPKEIQWRSQKKYLTAVWLQNLLKYEKKYLENVIYYKKDLLSNFMNPFDIQMIYERYNHKPTNYQKSDAVDVWNVITFFIWLEMNENFVR